MSKKSIEKAINDYIQTESGGSTFPTGWVIVASLAPAPGSTGRSDSYITLSSDGLPMHTMSGLMQVAQNDARNNAMIAAIHRAGSGGERRGDDN